MPIMHQIPPFLAPLFHDAIPAGFPSPASDYIDQRLDLHDYLGVHSEATFFLRVQGDSMQGAGIYDGDLLIVDKSLTPKNNSIVIAIVNNEFTVKRLKLNNGSAVLRLCFMNRNLDAFTHFSGN
jgi:DNA polymerase V